MERYVTKIVVDLTAWTEHYPTGCKLFHYDQVIDSEYCDNVDEFTDFIERYKESLLPGLTDVIFVFDGSDLDENYSTALDCAREILENVKEMIRR